MRFSTRLLPLLVLFSGFASASVHANNLHLVDSDSTTGFRLYRSGKPTQADYRELCALGVTRMIVLSGDAETVEKTLSKDCPQMEVIYDTRQTVGTPLSSAFLKQFDEWIRDAREKGTRIAFRCSCGCHRTGRLAAYYNMKYKGMSADEAIADMNVKGKYMALYPTLPIQVRALDDYIHARDCTENPSYCVDAIKTGSGSSWPRALRKE